MTCGLALDFSEWMDDVQQLSNAHFQAPVKIIDNLGTYNCRRQRNLPVLSEHAYGNVLVTGSVDYTIRDVIDDGTGMTTLMLETD